MEGIWPYTHMKQLPYGGARYIRSCIIRLYEVREYCTRCDFKVNCAVVLIFKVFRIDIAMMSGDQKKN